MRNRRLAALVLLVSVLVALVAAPAALAAAGSGASGFSSGGGGGGFGGGGHGGAGKAFEIYIIFRVLIDIAIWGHGLGLLLLLGLALAAYLYFYGAPKAWANYQARRQQGRADRRKTQKRQRKVELAAAEAADEDPIFDPDTVRAQAAELFTDVQAAWDAGNRHLLSELIAPRLASEWERRLDEMDRRGWRNRVQPTAPPDISFVGINNRDPASAEVVVKIEAKMRDYVVDNAGRHIKRQGKFTETTRLREFWTLRRQGSRWILQSIEQGSEGSHQLDDQIVQTSWADNQALRDEAMVEQANADKLSGDRKIGDYASFEINPDARAAANDLSLVDGRFAPDILEIAVRRAVQAWAQAVDGDTGALQAVATADAINELLYPDGPLTRIVVRGITAGAITITALEPHAEPPTMTVEAQITGRRYLQDRNTAAILAGSDTRQSTFVERWTLQLTGVDENPWRITAVGAPSAASR